MGHHQTTESRTAAPRPPAFLTAKGGPLAQSAEYLRLQAVLASTCCFFLASTLPAVSYYYVFQHDHMVLGPQAWGHWGVCLVASLLGIVAHGSANRVLTALHVAVGGMLGAALGGYSTAFWYSLDFRCQVVLAANPTNEVCSAVAVQHTKYILAFTGLAAVVFLAIPVAYSVLTLCRAEGAGAVRAAKCQAVCYAVDTQTCLVQGGEKPSVTPAMLTEWVNYLLEAAHSQRDPDCNTIAEQCIEALSERGYSLPVVRPAKKGEGKKVAGQEDGGVVASMILQTGGSVRIGLEDKGGLSTAEQGKAAQVTLFVSPVVDKAKPPRRPQVMNAGDIMAERAPSTTIFAPLAPFPPAY